MRNKSTFLRIRNAAKIPQDGVVDIDGEIVTDSDWLTEDGAVIAKGFREKLAGLKNIRVRINSPGGDVMAGAEIYSALREHSMNGEGRITVEITGVAASAASIIAMAGDEILISPAAYMMIHNPWTMAVGDAKEMRRTAKTLDQISEGLINAYQLKTGKTRDQIRRMLENETWMDARACVKEGFADGIIGGDALMPEGKGVQMSMKKHGMGEIAARMRGFRAEDEEEEEKLDPEEPEDEEEELEPDEDPENPEDEDDDDQPEPDEENWDEDEEENPDEDPENPEDEDDDDQPEPDEEESWDEDPDETPEQEEEYPEDEEDDEPEDPDDDDLEDEDEEEDPEEKEKQDRAARRAIAKRAEKAIRNRIRAHAIRALKK